MKRTTYPGLRSRGWRSRQWTRFVKARQARTARRVALAAALSVAACGGTHNDTDDAGDRDAETDAPTLADGATSCPQCPVWTPGDAGAEQ